MPFGSRVWRIHVIVSVPVSRAQRGNGRCWNSESMHPARFNLEAISFELKLPVLVTPGAAPQLHP
jgi:hypothetical protein